MADYILQLSEVVDLTIEDLRCAFMRRLDHFVAHGCRAVVYGIERVQFVGIPEDRVLNTILLKRLAGGGLDEREIAPFSAAILVWLGQQYAQRGWVMQYHFGAICETNPVIKRKLGTSSGFDSIGDSGCAEPLAHLLDAINEDNWLPKTICTA